MQSILDIPQHGDGNAVTIVGQPAFARRHPFLNAVVQAARYIIAGSREGLAMQDRYEALSRLSNRELTQRGLTRADIPRLALIEYRTAIAERETQESDDAEFSEGVVGRGECLGPEDQPPKRGRSDRGREDWAESGGAVEKV